VRQEDSAARKLGGKKLKRFVCMSLIKPLVKTAIVNLAMNGVLNKKVANWLINSLGLRHE